ncbi:MAG: hypothetical protein ACXVJ7_03200 [Acidimicrobiia bacterium]
MHRVLLAGAPRSGTSWTGQALGCCAGVRYVDEPDGFRGADAFRVMMRYGENPQVAPGSSAPEYAALWDGVFAGARAPSSPTARLAAWAYHRAGTDARRRARAGGPMTLSLRVATALARPPVADPRVGVVVVKSVQCAGSIEWLAARYSPVTVVLSRHPLNAIASWRDLGFVRNPRETAALATLAARCWGVDPPAEEAPALAQQAFVYGVIASAFDAAAARHPEWVTARHEDLCVDPETSLRALAERCGLEWTPAADRFVATSDRAGSGFATARVAAEQATRWRERLSPDDVLTIRRVLAGFPISQLVDG